MLLSDLRHVGMDRRETTGSQTARSAMVQPSANDAYVGHYAQRFRPPAQLARIPPVQFLSVPDSC